MPLVLKWKDGAGTWSYNDGSKPLPKISYPSQVLSVPIDELARRVADLVVERLRAEGLIVSGQEASRAIGEHLGASGIRPEPTSPIDDDVLVLGVDTRGLTKGSQEPLGARIMKQDDIEAVQGKLELLRGSNRK